MQFCICYVFFNNAHFYTASIRTIQLRKLYGTVIKYIRYNKIRQSIRGLLHIIFIFSTYQLC